MEITIGPLDAERFALLAAKLRRIESKGGYVAIWKGDLHDICGVIERCLSKNDSTDGAWKLSA